jgi:hypothetical protein
MSRSICDKNLSSPHSHLAPALFKKDMTIFFLKKLNRGRIPNFMGGGKIRRHRVWGKQIRTRTVLYVGA